MKKILITGAGGYVGAKLVPALLDKDYSVTALDLFIYGKEVLDEHKNLKVVVGDIRNTNILKEVIPSHDAVIHLACISNDPSFELNPQLGQSINLDAFEPMVQISKKEKIKRFIYASSSSVYGLKSEKNVTEDVSLEPLTDYSKFKVECEKILKPFNSEDFTTVTIRPATVCGYSRRQRLDVVVNILTNLAFNKREISIFGGKQLRPNIHIDDMVRSYILMLEAKKDNISGEVYNVGYDNLSIENIATKVKNIIGEDVKLKTTPTDDNRSYHISSSKIQKQLDFSPKFGVEDAIRDLKLAFEKKLLPNSLSDDVYFNIKRMEKIKLK
ncbi:SDR family oxidoreductase [Candidatus Pelagibacter sp.]|nr:SDR family oxidoreductase [Candidatus Pelagibacter sp.]